MRSIFAVPCLLLFASQAAIGAVSRHHPKAYDFEALSGRVQEKGQVGGALIGVRNVSLDELAQQVRDAVRKRKSPEKPIILGGLTDILGYRWNRQQQSVALIGDTGDLSVSPIYAEQFAVALRVAHYPIVIQSLNPSGPGPEAPQLVLAYPKEIVDTVFLEVLVQADYFLKAIVMNHVKPIVQTPKTAMDETVRRCKQLQNPEEVKGPPDNIFFQPVHPVLELERTKDGFTLWIKDINLRLRAGHHVKNPAILTFVDQVNQHLPEFIATYPRVFRPLINMYKVHILAQLLTTEEEAKIDLSYWLKGFPVAPHPTPRELPTVLSRSTGRFCEGPFAQYDEHVSWGQLWGGIILPNIQGFELPGRTQVFSGIYRSRKGILTFRSDGVFESNNPSGAAVIGTFRRLKDSSIAINAPEWQDIMHVTEGGLQGEDGVLWLDEMAPTGQDGPGIGDLSEAKGSQEPREPADRNQAVSESHSKDSSASGLETCPGSRGQRCADGPQARAEVLGSARTSKSLVDLQKEVQQLATRVELLPGFKASEAGATETARSQPTGGEEVDQLKEAAELREILGDTGGAWEELMDALSVAQAANEKWRAEELAAEVKELAERSQLSGELRVQLSRASWLECQASQLASDGAYRDAISALLEALRLQREARRFETWTHTRSLQNLAQLYWTIGDFDQSASRAREAMESARAITGETHPLYARSLLVMAESFEGLGQYAPAVLHFEEALDILRHQPGPKSREYAAGLVGLASLYRETEDLARAEILYLEALRIQREVLPEGHPEVAGTLNGLGLVYLAQAEYRLAEDFLKGGLEVRRKSFGPTHPQVLESLNNLANLNSEEGHFEEAGRLFRQVLKLVEEGKVDIAPWDAILLNNFAQHLYDQGDYRGAEKTAERALGIARKQYGPKHPSYASLLNTLAGTYASLGDLRKAKNLYREALSVLESFPWERHAQLAVTLANLGLILEYEGDNAGARVAFERVVLLTRHVLGESHPLYARGLGLLGELSNREGKKLEAETLYRRALDALHLSGNEGSPGYGEILKMATVLRLRHKRPEGIEVVDLVSEVAGLR